MDKTIFTEKSQIKQEMFEDEKPKNTNYMILDTETSGLPKMRFGKYKYYSYNELNKYDSSRLVQLAYQIFDKKEKLIKSENKIIKPDNFIISDDIIKIHGITNKIANEKGITIPDILKTFYQDLQTIDIIVGHNIQFDKQIIFSESYRYSQFNVISLLKKKTCICTSILMTPLCKLPSIETKYIYKSPSLIEAYQHLFKSNPDISHDAFYDVVTCSKIFFYLKDNGFLL